MKNTKLSKNNILAHNYAKDFPLLKRKKNNRSLVYFDNAATSPKLKQVIQAVLNYYSQSMSNVHRGPNFLSQEASLLYENSRAKIAQFIGAKPENLVFSSGTTASINLLAQALAKNYLKAGDLIVLSEQEHNANLLPWLEFKKRIGLELAFIKLDKESGLFEESSWRTLLSKNNLKLLALSPVSNVLGQYNEVKEIISLAKKQGALSLVDGAQLIAHRRVDLEDLGPDFFSFSAHKLYAPSGLGVLYLNSSALNRIPHFFLGGGVLESVSKDSYTLRADSSRLEAGTPNIEGVIGLGAAIDRLEELGFKQIEEREKLLSEYFLEQLKTYPYLKLLGSEENRLSLFSLFSDKFHPHDMADYLGEQGIISRAGRHCADLVHQSFRLKASLRLSLAYYNTKEEIDYFFKKLEEFKNLLA